MMALLSAALANKGAKRTLKLLPLLSLPTISLYYGFHNWTEAHSGFGARWIAVIDAATASPFAQLSMIPLLTLIARYAPSEYRTT